METQGIPAADGFPYCLTAGSAAETVQLGKQVAALLQGGEILLFHGPLGAGKTCFIQGLCSELAVQQEVVSPTFTLVNTYSGRLKVHHLDFYRVGENDDLTDIGVPDILDEVWDQGVVLLVEWPELLIRELAPDQRWIELLALPGAGPTERLWHLRGFPDVPAAWRELFDPKED